MPGISPVMNISDPTQSPATPPFAGGSIPGLPIGQPGQPITRPSFLQAFLANLGPALAGGLAQTGDPRFPFGSGLPGALQGIQQQTQRNREFGLQQQQLAQQARAQASTQAYQAAETSRLQQLTPLDVKQKQLEGDLLQAQVGFFGNPSNLDNAVGSATQSLGKLTTAEQAQIDAAKQDARLKRSFDPITKAVTTISQDRIQTERGNLDPAKRELNDYLNNPNLDKGIKKDAATFVAWKAKQNPAAITLGNILPAGSALDQQAELYSQTHELPAGLTRSPGTTAAIIARAAQLHPDNVLAQSQAQFEGDKKSLANLQKNFDQVTAFENTAIKNLDQVAKTGAKVPDLGSRFANVPVRSINAKMLGTKEMAAFRTALLTAQTEAAKVLTSANANGVLSNQARDEAEAVLDGNLPFPAMMASINQLKTDFGNRHSAYQQQIDQIKGRMSNKPSGTPPPGANVISLKDFLNKP